MVLRIPKTVGDYSLLSDEPFKTLFEGEIARGNSFVCLRTDTRPQLFVDIERCMQEEMNGVRVVVYGVWLV